MLFLLQLDCYDAAIVHIRNVEYHMCVSLYQDPSHAVLFILSWHQNHVVERIWVEINKRVNYPLKKALIDMENENLIKIHDNVNTLHRFCVSWLAVRVANVGASLAVEAWNEHSIPGELVYYDTDHVNCVMYTH